MCAKIERHGTLPLKLVLGMRRSVIQRIMLLVENRGRLGEQRFELKQ